MPLAYRKKRMKRHEEEHERKREATESKPEPTIEESKPLGSPEHQKKARKTMNYVKRSLLVHSQETFSGMSYGR